MIGWSGRLTALYAGAHILGALFWEGAALHAKAWLSGALWHEDLSAMSPAGSALWLSIESSAIPLSLVGILVIWLDHRGISPPAFLGWALIIWALVDGVISLFTLWSLLLLAGIMLVAGIRRVARNVKSDLAG